MTDNVDVVSATVVVNDEPVVSASLTDEPVVSASLTDEPVVEVNLSDEPVVSILPTPSSSVPTAGDLVKAASDFSLLLNTVGVEWNNLIALFTAHQTAHTSITSLDDSSVYEEINTNGEFILMGED